jgi:hypothetical protein
MKSSREQGGPFAHEVGEGVVCVQQTTDKGKPLDVLARQRLETIRLEIDS